MPEEPTLSTLQSRLHEALATADKDLADIYLAMLNALHHIELPDRHAVIAYEARELMNQAPLQFGLPSAKSPKKPESLAALVNDLDKHFMEFEQRKEQSNSPAPGSLDPAEDFLEYVKNWLDRTKAAHPAKRRQVRYLVKHLDPSHSAPHAKRFELIFNRWNRLESFFNSLLHHRNTVTEAELQQEIDGLESFLSQRICPTPFAAQKDLEYYAQQDPSSLSSEDVDKLLRLLAALDTNHRFFFASLFSPSWISFLDAEGFFNDPIPIEEDQGQMLAPDWPELRYVERVTPQAPEEAAEVALEISRKRPDNPRLHDALLGIVEKLFPADPQHAKKLLKEELEWIKEQPRLHYLIPEKLLKIGISAARSKCFSTAIRVSRVLLGLEVSPQVETELSEDNWMRVEQWSFHEILKNAAEDFLPLLDEPTQLEFLRALLDLFDLSLRRQLEDTPNTLAGRVLLMWRPAIEDHPQNDPNSITSWIIEAIRDAAQFLIPSHGQTVLSTLEKRGSDTLGRIAIFLRQLHPEVDPDGTAALMTNPDALRNVILRHELFQLLEHNFVTTAESTQKAYFEFVTNLADSRAKQLYLWPLREFLPPSWAETFAQLEKQLGPLDHPDFPVYHEEVWVGPTSPYSADEMLRMSPERLVVALNAWRFTGEWREPEPEGLARELTNLVARDATRLSAGAEAFESLTQQTYVRGIAGGLAKAVKAKEPISWDPVLHFCKWAVDQPRGEGPEGSGLELFDKTWGPARKQIARLLGYGVQESSAEIPFKLRENVWSILVKLVTDVDPTEEDEKARAEYTDPSTIAINTVRGVALNTVLSYALWVVRHTTVRNRSWNSFGLEKVRKALENRLASDSSAAVHSVFGKWFSYLFWLDEAWTRTNVDRIFPQGESTEKLWHASWEAYLVFGSTIYLDSFDLLRPSYERGADELGREHPDRKRLVNPDERLGGHLMLFFREGVLKKGDPLLLSFFKRAEPKLRYSVMVDAVRQLQKVPEERRGAVVKRLRQLWEWRCTATIDDKYVEYHELSAFSWWFLKDDFSPEWRLAELTRIQRERVKLELDGRVLEKLVELSVNHLAKVLDCLDAIVRNPNNRHWGIYKDHVKEILRVALDTTDTDVSRKASDLVNYIGSLGFGSFRGLLSE